VRSVRHTAKAVSVLLLTGENPELAAEIAWRLVESAEEFMNADGGCREELLPQPSSIYASAYMLQLFASILADGQAPDSIPELDSWTARAEELLGALHPYMSSSWEESRWDWGETPWQVNAPYIVADVGPWLLPELREKVRSAIRDELTPQGRLRESEAGCEFGAPEPLLALHTAHALRSVSNREQLGDRRLEGLCRWLLGQDWAGVRCGRAT
jgi:hypothetical protein